MVPVTDDDIHRITLSSYPAADAEAKSAEGNDNRCAGCTCHVKRIEELEEQLKSAQESLFTVEGLYRMATARCEAVEDQLLKINANSRQRMIQ